MIDFESGMDVVDRRTVLSISKIADLRGFSRTSISGVYRECPEKEKNPMIGISVGRNVIYDRGRKGMVISSS